MNKTYHKIKHIKESNILLENRVIYEKTKTNYYNPDNLKFGDGGKKDPKNSEKVKILQQKLMDDGFLKTKSMVPTGYFGTLTNAALEKALGIKTTQNSDIKKNDIKPKTKDSILVSPNVDPKILKKINLDTLSTTDTTHKICTVNTPDCAQFVNDFSTEFKVIGNAWIAYNNSSLGSLKYDNFSGLNPKEIKKTIDLWLKIDKNGGGKKNGTYKDEVREFVNTLVPKSSENVVSKLKLGDVVGIFYYPSSHHEEAFYQGGEKWFKNVNGKKVPGKTIKNGEGWGMNTHVGIVGVIKNGVPLIFHNIKGTVQSDPPSKLRIAWVRG